MRDVAVNDVVNKTDPDLSKVIFMPPSTFGFAVQSPLYDISEGTPKFIAILSAKAKFGYLIPPGKRRFMVTGESADFMSANLLPGRVYYVLVSPRLGFWKARFSITPISSSKISGEEFADWFNDSRWVMRLPSADKWAVENMPSVVSKMNANLPQWEAKPNRPHMKKMDGLLKPYRPAK